MIYIIIYYYQGMQFYATEFLKYAHKYAGKFWKICGSNMQQNMHFAILCNDMQFYACKTPNSVFF
jgi:hypothetical protein